LPAERIDETPHVHNNIAMPSAAIEMDGLTKDYGVGFWMAKKLRSLDGLTLRIETGEVFGLLGPNGAGKTTAIKLLLGLIFPTSGTAQILGRPISDVRMHREIGYLPEQPYFYDYLTAHELLDYFARFHDLTATDRRERVDRLLRKVGLESARKIQLRKYSKGMLQRVGLAQAIVHDPKLVILDEPMSGLDPVGRREVRDIILEMKGRGTTVLFSTHILTDAEMLCDRVGVLAAGKLRGVGAPGEALGVKAQGMEILFELPGGQPPGATSILQRATQTGNRYRIETPEESLFDALEQLRGAGARIYSVTPIKPTLEDYFLQLIGPEGARAAAVEVTVK
jgi:ABC-2 type transport system ATP-binding protein